MTDFILILAGPSGVGKTTVAEELALRNPRFVASRSHTTRERRGDGRDGEYIYVTKPEFLNLVSHGEMLEYTSFGAFFPAGIVIVYFPSASVTAPTVVS